tara:strand:- start:1062 stop:1220 length:159 start_codon:yes stop_codon:yes gene_type:complete
MQNKTAYFLLKTIISNDIADSARDIEQEAQAVCVDYMFLEDVAEGNTPYIAY